MADKQCWVCDRAVNVDDLHATVKYGASLQHFFCSPECHTRYFEPNPARQCSFCTTYVVVKKWTPTRDGGKMVFCNDECLGKAVQLGQVKW